MKEYLLLDHDDSGDEKLLPENGFVHLLDTCFRYSEIFVTWYSQKTYNCFPQLTPFLLREKATERKLSEKERKSYPYLYKCTYRCCEESKQAILSISRNMWSFICAWGYENPENLEFYRADESCFFSAIVHEGEATLYPRENEDVSEILEELDWMEVTEPRYPDSPLSDRLDAEH